MSDLPDLDTSQISWIAYWNAIDDGGVAEIDPESALDDSSIQSYTLYDNGWEGQYLGSTREFNVRVKTDGWIVAYLDRLDAYDINVNDERDIDGQYDILDGWYSTIEENVLERAINSIQNSLDADLNYSTQQAGLYNYDNQATNITILRDSQGGGGSADLGLLLSELNVVYAAALGWGEGAAYTDYGDGKAYVTFEGQEICTAPKGGGVRYGSIDITGIITSMETEYLANLNSTQSSGQYGGDDTSNCRIATLILWDPVS